MGKFQQVMSSIRHNKVTKYILTIAFFALLIIYVDENSVMNRMERIKEIETLQNEIADLKAKYEEDTRKLNELEEYEHVVRVAREMYQMKRPDEDIFIIKYE
ncbi:MAG: septum formation initiator family protein [Bacteroidaceae bacterium]|jgi:cell division protein FtsL|nr:septum formation initiator family protein [Bacteroidaceae bacterium]MBQ2363644.1 septum formation initiator family protein [Bacteroidaceae bacterium]MBQ5393036.1 septum formation initiator family protein [Bacteroidaceae bacterium]MBQ5694522.1 septum formation initiator family protein [Bacteroidaceae bacterium]